MNKIQLKDYKHTSKYFYSNYYKSDTKALKRINSTAFLKFITNLPTIIDDLIRLSIKFHKQGGVFINKKVLRSYVSDTYRYVLTDYLNEFFYIYKENKRFNKKWYRLKKNIFIKFVTFKSNFSKTFKQLTDNELRILNVKEKKEKITIYSLERERKYIKTEYNKCEKTKDKSKIYNNFHNHLNKKLEYMINNKKDDNIIKLYEKGIKKIQILSKIHHIELK